MVDVPRRAGRGGGPGAGRRARRRAAAARRRRRRGDRGRAARAILGGSRRAGQLRLPARVQRSRLALAVDGRFEPRFWPGVNLGVTVPGHSPGELAPTRADYDRWLDGMRRLGARVVRVYTIQRPDFYAALDAHNRRHPGSPLYFIQGIWIPEEEFLATRDAYAPDVTRGFDDEIAGRGVGSAGGECGRRSPWTGATASGTTSAGSHTTRAICTCGCAIARRAGRPSPSSATRHRPGDKSGARAGPPRPPPACDVDGPDPEPVRPCARRRGRRPRRVGEPAAAPQPALHGPRHWRAPSDRAARRRPPALGHSRPVRSSSTTGRTGPPSAGTSAARPAGPPWPARSPTRRARRPRGSRRASADRSPSARRRAVADRRWGARGRGTAPPSGWRRRCRSCS